MRRLCPKRQEPCPSFSGGRFREARLRSFQEQRKSAASAFGPAPEASKTPHPKAAAYSSHESRNAESPFHPLCVRVQSPVMQRMRISHWYALIKINKPRSALFGQENQQNQGSRLRRNAPPKNFPVHDLTDIKARMRLWAHLCLPRIARKSLGCAGIHGRSLWKLRARKGAAPLFSIGGR